MIYRVTRSLKKKNHQADAASREIVSQDCKTCILPRDMNSENIYYNAFNGSLLLRIDNRSEYRHPN